VYANLKFLYSNVGLLVYVVIGGHVCVSIE
jgi:hypothetical protein